jgi:hypothetical protein
MSAQTSTPQVDTTAAELFEVVRQLLSDYGNLYDSKQASKVKKGDDQLAIIVNKSTIVKAQDLFHKYKEQFMGNQPVFLLAPLTENIEEYNRIINWLTTALIDIKPVRPNKLKVGDIVRQQMTMDLNIQAVRFWRVVNIEKVSNTYSPVKDYRFSLEAIVEPNNGGSPYKQKYTTLMSQANPHVTYLVLREEKSEHKTWDEWHIAKYGKSDRTYPKSNIKNHFSLTDGEI